MSQIGFTKEVDWDYCNSCKHKKVDQSEDPCHECLNNPSNEFSHKPVNYEKVN